MATLVRDRSAAGPEPEQIDPRIAARREEVTRSRRLRRARRLTALAIVATLVAACYGLTRSAVFDVDAIVVGGAVHTSPDAIIAASGIRPGDQLLDVDLARAAAAIERLPWIAHASVARSWRSGDVVIEVSEREAVAQVAAGGVPEQVAVVDLTGRVLEVRTAGESGLTMVKGVAAVPVGEQLDEQARPALEIAAALTPGLQSRVAAVVVDGDNYGLELRPAGRARLGGADDLPEKLRSLQTMLAHVDLTGLCVIDLRVANSPVVDRRQPCA